VGFEVSGIRARVSDVLSCTDDGGILCRWLAMA